MGMRGLLLRKNTTVEPSKQQTLKFTYRGGAYISCLFLLLIFQQVNRGFFLGAVADLRKATNGPYSCNKSASTARIFLKFDLHIYRKSIEKMKI